jgi:hypothetical protein
MEVSSFIYLFVPVVKLSLTSPTSGGRSVYIVRSRTKPRSLDFSFFDDVVTNSEYTVFDERMVVNTDLERMW